MHVCVCLTDALPAHVIPVADVAHAAVAGGRQKAASVQTQVGEVFAHVDGVVLRGSGWREQENCVNMQFN